MSEFKYLQIRKSEADSNETIVKNVDLELAYQQKRIADFLEKLLKTVEE